MEKMFRRNVTGLETFHDNLTLPTDRYPESASSNPARVNIFQFTSAVSDYHEKFLFMYISEDDYEIELLD